MAFEKLPLEINELIASFLTNDYDLCRFTLLCHVTHQAVHSHHCTVWRERLNAKFDLPPGKQGCAFQKVLCEAIPASFLSIYRRENASFMCWGT